MLQLYENIKLLRISHGWNQSELAEKVGYSDKSMISKIEKGAVDLSRSQIVKFATVFGVTASVLMGDTLSPAAGTDLDPDEAKLLSDFRVLGDEGQAMLLSRAQELIKLGYTREEEAKKGVRS
jgi:transcriptional regulator with XRE-family HTH domain